VILDDEDNPLIVEFKGVQILDRTQVIPNPDDLKYKCDVVDGTLHFVIPSLYPKDALTVQILVPIYLYGTTTLNGGHAQIRHPSKASFITKSQPLNMLLPESLEPCRGRSKP
jgi:hypothetical protein